MWTVHALTVVYNYEKMKKIFTIIGILTCSSLLGQIGDYLNYQSKINQAELNLIRGNKIEALNNYYLVLSTSEGNFCKDVYNALLLSSELSKKDTFFILLELLLPKNLDNSYINKQFAEFHKYPEWNKFLTENRDQSNINKPLKEKIDSLGSIDQKFRVKKGSYKVYRDTISKIDSLNMEFLYELIALNQFPGENEIGIKNFLGWQGYDIVFHHYTQSTSLDKTKDKITPLLINLVLQGKLLPNKASHWLEMQNGEFTAGVFDVLNFNVNGKETSYFVPKYENRKYILINEYRKMLGMETLDEYYEKFLFKTSNPETKYIFDIYRNTFEIDSEMFEKFTKNMKELN